MQPAGETDNKAEAGTLRQWSYTNIPANPCKVRWRPPFSPYDLLVEDTNNKLQNRETESRHLVCGVPEVLRHMRPVAQEWTEGRH